MEHLGLKALLKGMKVKPLCQPWDLNLQPSNLNHRGLTRKAKHFPCNVVPLSHENIHILQKCDDFNFFWPTSIPVPCPRFSLLWMMIWILYRGTRFMSFEGLCTLLIPHTGHSWCSSERWAVNRLAAWFGVWRSVLSHSQKGALCYKFWASGNSCRAKWWLNSTLVPHHWYVSVCYQWLYPC